MHEGRKGGVFPSRSLEIEKIKNKKLTGVCHAGYYIVPRPTTATLLLDLASQRDFSGDIRVKSYTVNLSINIGDVCMYVCMLKAIVHN